MKKIEKEFLENLDESLDFSKSFEDIKDKIDVKFNNDYLKEVKPKWNAKLLFAGVFLLLVLIIPLTIFLVTSPKITEIYIANKDDLVVEYQRNCNFIESGIIIDKKMANGKIERAKEDEVVVDYASFDNQQEGTYEIDIYLKDNPKIRTSYEVLVTSDVVTSIGLKKSRTTYYMGESINSSDLIVEKQLENGDTKDTKLTEYSIDDSNFNTNQIGTYQIGVTLNSNNDFKLIYDVEVRPLSELDISGKYGIIDELFENTPPTILAMEIENDQIKVHYSEIIISENQTLKKEVIDGAIIISDSIHSQKMKYNPFTEQMIVNGLMVGDPDITCFKLDEDDYLISLTGNLVTTNVYYVAIDGYLSENTIKFLTNTYGGVYLDESKNVKVTNETLFTEDTVIVVGNKPVIDDEKLYLGKYYNEDNKIIFEIEEDGICYISSNRISNYYVELKDNGDIWIRTAANESILHYIIDQDIIESWSPDGYFEGVLKKFDSATQAIVTMFSGYNSTKYQFVVLKGESFETKVIKKDEMTFYSTSTYKGEPIYEDITLGTVVISHIYMTDFMDKVYGTYDNYLIIKNAWSLGRDYNISKYWYEIHKNFDVIESGWIEFNDYRGDNIIFNFHSDSGTDDAFIYHRISSAFVINDEEFTLNKKPFESFDFIGNYLGEDGSERIISEKGMLGVYTYKNENSASISYEHIYIKSLDSDAVTFWYIYQDENEKREVRYLNLTKEEGIWQFYFEGIKYLQYFEE